MRNTRRSKSNLYSVILPEETKNDFQHLMYMSGVKHKHFIDKLLKSILKRCDGDPDELQRLFVEIDQVINPPQKVFANRRKKEKLNEQNSNN